MTNHHPVTHTMQQSPKSPWLLGFSALFRNGSAPFVWFRLDRGEHEIEHDQQSDSDVMGARSIVDVVET